MDQNKGSINNNQNNNDSLITKHTNRSMDIVQRSVTMTRKRLQLFRVLTYGGYGCVCGLVAGVFLLLAARMWPIEDVRYWAMGGVCIGIVLGLIWGWFHRITRKESATIMDASIDGTERSDMMVTALSFEDLDTAAVSWQREQAATYGQRFTKDMKERLPRPRRRKLWLTCGSMFIVVLILVVLPNSKDKVLAEAKQQQDWVKTQEQQVSELAQKLKASQLPSITKQPLQEQMDKLQKELDGEKDPKQALDQLEKSMKSMEKLAKQQEMKKKALSEIAEKMRQVSQLSSLAKSLQSMSKDDLQKAMSDLKKEMQKLSLEQKEKLRESFKKLDEDTPTNADNKKIKDALKQLEQALEKGDAAEQEKALQQLAEELSKAIEAKSAATEQSDAASALSAALAQQGLGLADQMAAAGLSYSDTWSSGGSAEMLAQVGAAGDPSEVDSSGAGQGASAGAGSTPGSGAGQGNGAGQGSGSGQGAGQGGSGSGGSGVGAGAGLGTGGRELVTTPRLLEGKDGLQSDGGPIQGGGGSIQKGGTSPTIDGASRPYEEVYEQYADEAKKSIDRNDLPQQMQGLVEEYFISINPNP